VETDDNKSKAKVACDMQWSTDLHPPFSYTNVKEGLETEQEGQQINPDKDSVIYGGAHVQPHCENFTQDIHTAAEELHADVFNTAKEMDTIDSIMKPHSNKPLINNSGCLSTFSYNCASTIKAQCIIPNVRITPKDTIDVKEIFINRPYHQLISLFNASAVDA